MALNPTQDGARGTLARSDKGPIAPPPTLNGPLAMVADMIRTWPRIIATTHWHLTRRSQVDGIDFYVGEQELGHIHLDGSIHLATNPHLGKILIREGLAQPFRYGDGWVEATIHSIGPDAAISLFRRNYERLARDESAVSALLD